MEYLEALDYLYSLERSSAKLGLENIGELLNRWGNPQSSFPAIHIGGTNGKGSTCSIISSVLSSAGYKTGLYTSPHLQSFVERIQIDNKPIQPERFGEMMEEVAGIVAKMGGKPTVFEVATAIALKHFEEEGVDISVVEVGMGGRLDATKLVNPVVTGITNVELDHQRILGDRRARIAFEKGSIAKPNVPMVLGLGSAEVRRVIFELCKEVGAPIHLVDEVPLTKRGFDREGQVYDIRYDGEEMTVETHLLGHFQDDNLRMAIKVLELSDMGVTSESIREGLAKVRHPGRMERVSDDPLVILDGAHNPSKTDALVRSLNDFFPSEFAFIFGVMKDKDVKNMLQKLSGVGKRFYLTRINYPRSMDPKEIGHLVSGISGDLSYELAANPMEALRMAEKDGKKNICVTGSLYIAGYLRSFYKEPVAWDNHNF